MEYSSSETPQINPTFGNIDQAFRDNALRRSAQLRSQAKQVLVRLNQPANLQPRLSDVQKRQRALEIMKQAEIIEIIAEPSNQEMPQLAESTDFKTLFDTTKAHYDSLIAAAIHKKDYKTALEIKATKEEALRAIIQYRNSNSTTLQDDQSANTRKIRLTPVNLPTIQEPLTIPVTENEDYF